MNINELVIYYGTVTTKINNKYYLNGAFGRYVDELSNYYDRIYLVLPTRLKDECEETDYCLTSNNIIMQELPYYDGVVDALRKKRDITDALRKYSKYWNSTIYIRWPTPFFKLLTKIANRKCLPVCYHLVGDSEIVVKKGTKYKGILRMIAIAYAKYNAWQVKRIIKETPTLVNGNGLRRLYTEYNPYIKEIRTSTFYKNEIIQREPRDIKECINLLYVGYLRHEKGLEYLIKAVDLIKRNNIICKLSIVGDGDKRKELEDLVHAMHLDECVKFCGYIPVGDTLFSEYKNADIFVLPSISEGTPRVLLEAMSCGAAVVATETGGIPFTVTNLENGLLVPIKSAEKIAEAIIRLRDDRDLYLKIIKNGYKTANMNTIEHHVEEVYHFIQDFCLGKKS
jgi:glycosyltransferase involved in cell wall biosynthesis